MPAVVACFGLNAQELPSDIRPAIFFPGGVRCVIQADSADLANATKPALLVLYALPNGNTIEQTIGKVVGPGDDWHFGIQHIGAQTRLLQSLDTATNLIVAYLEAPEKSWPAWRAKHPDSTRAIALIVDSLRAIFSSLHPAIVLSGHSGGGSFIFGFLNQSTPIPDCVERIVFLDATYGFNPTEPHAANIIGWLKSSRKRALVVVSYDDREIVLNGKKIIGPTGGTYRRSLEMAEFLSSNGIPLATADDGVFLRRTCSNPAVSISIHRNPSNEILHTVLVERNGFLHGLTVFRGIPGAPILWGEAAYGRFISH